ncbi:hypothetical protein Droror1_Dr00006172 [Drosera rotundifolia]
MNRFNASSDYNYYDFMDVNRRPYIDRDRRKIDFGALPIVPTRMRFYGIKQNMVLQTIEGEIKETVERTLIIFKENEEDQIKVVIAASHRMTTPNYSSYFRYVLKSPSNSHGSSQLLPNSRIPYLLPLHLCVP